MRAVLVAVVALAVGGCRDDVTVIPPDFSAPELNCPTDPPTSATYACDPGAIPFCTYPTQGMTCVCAKGSDGNFELVCGAEQQPDGGEPTGTGT